MTYDTPIDASGAVPGVSGTAKNGVELVKLLATSPEIESCFASHWMRFAYGRSLDGRRRLQPAVGRDRVQGRRLQRQAAPAGAHAERRLPLPPGCNRRHSAMTRFKLDRRTVIKGAGTIAIALPWLEVMGLRAPGPRADGLRAAEAVRDRVSAGRSRSQRCQRRQVHAHRHRDVVHALADPGAAAADAEPAPRRRRPQPHLRRSIEVHRSSSTRAAPSAGSPARSSRGPATTRPRCRRPSTRCWRRGCRPASPTAACSSRCAGRRASRTGSCRR